MGKKAKEHRRRVALRNQRIADEKKRREKAAMNFLKEMIERENKMGAFNNPVQPIPNFDGMMPTIGIPNTGPFMGIDLPSPTFPTNFQTTEFESSNVSIPGPVVFEDTNQTEKQESE